MRKFTYYPQGTCSVMIEIELDGDVIEDVAFTGGCNGNLSGISKLIRGTSCPDQLSRALRQALSEAKPEERLQTGRIRLDQ